MNSSTASAFTSACSKAQRATHVGKKTERQSRAVEQLPAALRYFRDLRRKQ
jgi:hypothetical protein